MKTLYKALCLLALPAAASAQVQLLAGWNFGQFISNTVPSTNGSTGEATGSIASNYVGFSRPGPETSGPERALAGSAASYSAGTGVISWDGSNGSEAWAYVDGTAVFVNNQPETYSAINGNLVTANDFAAGQTANWQLRFTSSVSADDFSIRVNTVGYEDFNPANFSQTNDYNFSFAAFGTGSVTFFVGGNQVGSPITVTSDESAYNLDLPAEFYGSSTSTLIARISGTVNFDNIQINGVAIPEPTTYAALVGLVSLAVVGARRRKHS